METRFHLDKASENAPCFKGDIVPLDMPGRRLRAVVVGGGSGAPISIKVLLAMGFEVSAVVAMADDGGSTGVLRAQEGVTAPGDIRKCLCAFAGDDCQDIAQALQTRFAIEGDHALGNLLLAILERESGSFVSAISRCEELLHARGHVYPSTLSDVRLRAQTVSGKAVYGQVQACQSHEPLQRIWLESDGPIVSNPEACQVISRADVIVLGPGSLYTSVLPNLAVPGIAEAVRASAAKCVYVGSIADTQGETRGMDALDYLDALSAHGLGDSLDFALMSDALNWSAEGLNPVRIDRLGDLHAKGDCLFYRHTEVLIRDISDKEAVTWHDPLLLSHAIEEVVRKCRLLQR